MAELTKFVWKTVKVCDHTEPGGRNAWRLLKTILKSWSNFRYLDMVPQISPSSKMLEKLSKFLTFSAEIIALSGNIVNRANVMPLPSHFVTQAANELMSMRENEF